MPIYEQTYKPWEARTLLRWRWRPIMIQELRIAMTSRLFKFLMLLALLPFLIFFVMVLSINAALSNPDSLAGAVLEETRIIQVDALFFWRYLRLCTPLVVLFTLAVGSGVICNDLRNNLLEIYFAKPLTSLDYFLGKLAAVLFFPLTITVVPSLLFFGLHLMVTPGNRSEFLQEYAYLLLAMPAYALTMALPPATLAMLCSALSHSTRFAAVAFIAFIFMSRALAEFTAEITQRPNLRLWGAGPSTEVLGSMLMLKTVPEGIYWPYAVLMLSAWCLIAAGLTFYRVRAVEVGS
jgi:hypothetical protein